AENDRSAGGLPSGPACAVGRDRAAARAFNPAGHGGVVWFPVNNRPETGEQHRPPIFTITDCRGRAGRTRYASDQKPHVVPFQSPNRKPHRRRSRARNTKTGSSSRRTG